MHPKTPDLARKIRAVESTQERLDILRNAYEGETCYTLTCGPSLNAFWNNRIQEKIKDSLVMSVKQTYNLAPAIMDFHILNSWNYSEYDYAEPRPIVFLERNRNDPETPNARPDCLFNIPDPSSLDKRLAVTHNWDEFCFDRQLDRPWGPGVMYELAIYMWVLLGIKEVIVLGWDLGEINSPKMDHFFDTETRWQRVARTLSPAALWRRMTGKGQYPSDLEVLNKPRIRDFEVKDIADSTESMYYWLESRGISLKIVSDRSLISGVVPRVDL